MDVCQRAPCHGEKSGASRWSRLPHRSRWDTVPPLTEDSHRIGRNVLLNMGDSALPRPHRVHRICAHDASEFTTLSAPAPSTFWMSMTKMKLIVSWTMTRTRMEHTGEEDGDKDDVLLVLMFACTGQM